MTQFREITSGLRFPKGPIAMPDGSVILVEIERQTLTRVLPDGTQEIIAKTGGGPNGAAMGPDGKCYICNNGGFNWGTDDGILHTTGASDDYVTGSIQRVDLESGEVETLYTEAMATIFAVPTTSSSIRPAISGSRIWARRGHGTWTVAGSITPDPTAA